MPSPELAALIQLIRSQPLLPESPAAGQLRANFEQATAALPVDPDVHREAALADAVAAEWFTLEGAARDAAILYLHGGGYVVGSIRSHAGLTAQLARAANVRLLSLDYRLAPEHPHPAAVEDAVAAYRWLQGQGIAPKRIVIAGDSAGGGLTVATLLALRDAGDPLPAAAVCLSPWLDMELTGESIDARAADDPIVQRDALARYAAWYLGGADPRTPLASPLHARLDGLPPLLIQVGTAETLLDDAIRFARRAQAAGIAVTLEPWEEMIHVWQFFAFTLPEGRQAIARIAEFIRQHIG
jgi:acetyl esterase/lipase